ncbi:hypothetical protein JCM11641_002092 [Rhodosporidiobolus odoratus]
MTPGSTVHPPPSALSWATAYDFSFFGDADRAVASYFSDFSRPGRASAISSTSVEPTPGQEAKKSPAKRYEDDHTGAVGDQGRARQREMDGIWTIVGRLERDELEEQKEGLDGANKSPKPRSRASTPHLPAQTDINLSSARCPPRSSHFPAAKKLRIAPVVPRAFLVSSTPATASIKTASSSQSSSPSSSPPATLPTLPISESDFFPNLTSLTYAAYRPYLLEEPIEIDYSLSYYESILRSSRAPFLQQSGLFKLRAMTDILRWVWEDENVTLANMTWLVKEARQDASLVPILIIVRELATTLRFSNLVQFSYKELCTFIASTPFLPLTPAQDRARTLLEWLSEDSSRWHLFFCRPAGCLRCSGTGQELWEWWLKGAEDGTPRNKLALDDWERKIMREEDWRQK